MARSLPIGAAAAALALTAAPALAEPPSYAEYCRVITAAVAASPGSFETIKAAPAETGFATTLRPSSEADGFHCQIDPASEARPLMLTCVAYIRLLGLDGWTHECLKDWARRTDGQDVAFFAPAEGRRTVLLITPFRGFPNVTTIQVLENPGPTT